MKYEYRFKNIHLGLLLCLGTTVIFPSVIAFHWTPSYKVDQILMLSVPFYIIGILLERFRLVYLSPVQVSKEGIFAHVSDGTYSFLNPKKNILLVSPNEIESIKEVTHHHDPRFSRLDENGGLEIKSSKGVIYIYRFIEGYDSLKESILSLNE